MDVHAREPIVPDKTALSAVRDVPLLVVEVPLRKAKIDHVYHLVSRLKADDAISELYIPVQDAPRVNKLQARDLRTFPKSKSASAPRPHKKKPPPGAKGRVGAPAEWR